MATFIKLEDSPMFQKQVHSLEQTADDLRDRCQKLYKGSMKFMAALGEAIDGDTAFADSVEAFAGGDDPISISIGGPVISKFITAFHEIVSYKELLRSQVEHVLVDRLMNFISVDLQEAKDSRRRFDKAAHSYDQAREKFTSLKKSTPEETIAELEEDLQNSKSTFDRSRFNLVHVLMNIEAKKKFEFLESISVIMDAHLRYFKLGYELLRQMEPFIHQVLTYTQQSKEMAIVEQDRLATRIQEFRTQAELDNLQDSINAEKTATAEGTHTVAGVSCKKVEAMMQATATTSGEVQTIRQGYLLKRSSSSRGDWKRRFFVLDSHGTLYYYKNNNVKHTGFHSHHSTSSFENHSSVFGRFRTKHFRASSVGEETLDYRVVDLRTSTLKIDADDSSLRLCFRIISPRKTYTLKAENEADWRDWMNKIKGVIASLLSSHFLQQPFLGPKRPGRIRATGDGSQSVLSPGKSENYHNSDDVAITLRSISGNNLCAECSLPDPDWASLNLGVVLCIECSGIHRNFGVHISKVRSITLDVKVWDPTVLELFRNLGNTYCNSIWEGLLLQKETRNDEENGVITSISKPSPGDPTHLKEKFLHAKYVEKRFVAIDKDGSENCKKHLWEAVETNNLRKVYRLIVTSPDRSIVNTVFDEAVGEDDLDSGETRQDDDDLRGCSLLHLACRLGNLVMIELLLQFGADINFQDFSGKTPLHHCISMGSNSLAKVLLKRGARASIRDGGGQSVLERAMEMGAITDEELFILIAEC